MKTHKGYKTYPLTAAQKFHFFYLDRCPKKEVMNIGTSLTIEVELDIPENQTIKAEHDSFFQAVYNLFDNAVKFTEEGGTITVYMAAVNGRLQFNIINTGSQIPQDKIKFVFDRFYKGDTSRNRNSSGSGLGLYITKTVVKQHGGDIFVRSNDNKTEFCFTIPLNR